MLWLRYWWAFLTSPALPPIISGSQYLGFPAGGKLLGASHGADGTDLGTWWICLDSPKMSLLAYCFSAREETIPISLSVSTCLFITEFIEQTHSNWRRRQWQPTPVLLPGKSHGQRSLVGCSPWGHEESDTTEHLHFHFSLSCIGERNGNPLQGSCLENPRDREPGGLPSMGLHRVGYDWSDLAAAAA